MLGFRSGWALAPLAAAVTAALLVAACEQTPVARESVASVAVSPPTATVAVGRTERLTATALDAAGNRLPGRTVVWSTSDSAVAQVNDTGLVTGVAVGAATITAAAEGRNGAAAITVTAARVSGPLRVHPTNPRYFADATGRVVYLTGAHTWTNFVNSSPSDPPRAFDWSAYLTFLEQRGHNFIRLWRWEQARWSAETPDDLWFDPMPYRRTGPGTALDGKPKFDLTQFNQAYFDRLRQRVIEAGQRGFYVSIMLFNGWSIENKDLGIGNPWSGHPFHRGNNVNGIDGDPNNDGEGHETHTLQVPAVTALQEAYVRRVIDAVNDLDNVLYEISNESPGGGESWQVHLITYIHQYEAGKPKQHPVGMTHLWRGGNDADLFASPADWIAPYGGGNTTDPQAADGSKVILYDTDHVCGICGDEPLVWKSLTRGLNPQFMDPYDGAFPVSAQYDLADPRWEQIRVNLGYARSYANRVALAAMLPREDLASTGYCLAKPTTQEAEYLVYLPTGGSVTVDLTGVGGTLAVEWFAPGTGETTPGGTTVGGATGTFTAPSSGDAVLYLRHVP